MNSCCNINNNTKHEYEAQAKDKSFNIQGSKDTKKDAVLIAKGLTLKAVL